jgi:hypothetical protein
MQGQTVPLAAVEPHYSYLAKDARRGEPQFGVRGGVIDAVTR